MGCGTSAPAALYSPPVEAAEPRDARNDRDTPSAETHSDPVALAMAAQAAQQQVDAAEFRAQLRRKWKGAATAAKEATALLEAAEQRRAARRRAAGEAQAEETVGACSSSANALAVGALPQLRVVVTCGGASPMGSARRQPLASPSPRPTAAPPPPPPQQQPAIPAADSDVSSNTNTIDPEGNGNAVPCVAAKAQPQPRLSNAIRRIASREFLRLAAEAKAEVATATEAASEIDTVQAQNLVAHVMAAGTNVGEDAKASAALLLSVPVPQQQQQQLCVAASVAEPQGPSTPDGDGEAALVGSSEAPMPASLAELDAAAAQAAQAVVALSGRWVDAAGRLVAELVGPALGGEVLASPVAPGALWARPAATATLATTDALQSLTCVIAEEVESGALSGWHCETDRSAGGGLHYWVGSEWHGAHKEGCETPPVMAEANDCGAGLLGTWDVREMAENGDIELRLAADADDPRSRRGALLIAGEEGDVEVAGKADTTGGALAEGETADDTGRRVVLVVVGPKLHGWVDTGEGVGQVFTGTRET